MSCSYAVVQMTPPALDALHWKFYIIFAVINAAFLPPIYYFYPETKGKSLEEVDLLFAKGHPATFDQAAEEIKHNHGHSEYTSNREESLDDEKIV